MTRLTGAPEVAATGGPTNAAVILRVLRVCLHSGFAVLLLVAVARLLGTGLRGADWLTLGLALVLAAVYVLGTVLEKRHSTDPSRFDPRPYSHLWLGAVCLLWLLLIWASADFVWLAFPLFFLQLHVLPLRLALPAIALSTVLVIVALWFHNTGADGGALQLPMVLGPAFGAAFAVVTGLAYRALYLEAESQRLAAEELRRTRAELARSQHDAGTLAERARLAREIHDTLAQGFSSIVLMGRSAEKALDDGDTATARDRLRTVQETARANLAEARNFVRGLQPPALSEEPAENQRRPHRRTRWSTACAGSAKRPKPRQPPAAPGCAAASTLKGPRWTFPTRTAPPCCGPRRQASRTCGCTPRRSTAVVTLSFLGSEVAMDIYDDGAGFDPVGGHGPRRAPRRLGLRAEIAPGTGGGAGRQPGHRVRTRRGNGGGHPAPARGSPARNEP